MKAGEIRALSQDERHTKVADLKQELFNLRFQNAIGDLENPQRIKTVKRDIARVNTIIGESM